MMGSGGRHLQGPPPERLTPDVGQVGPRRRILVAENRWRRRPRPLATEDLDQLPQRTGASHDVAAQYAGLDNTGRRNDNDAGPHRVDQRDDPRDPPQGAVQAELAD